MRSVQLSFVSTFLIFIISGLLISQDAFAEEGTIEHQPRVPFKFAVGKKKFQESCSVCHGNWLEGTKQGPPLLHALYKPSHHADAAFYRAALNGVRAHHWKFGNMSPVPGITGKDMDSIVPFIRWYQQAKGLY